MSQPKITLIAAVAHANAIGFANRLLCRLPEDLRHFKQTTLGHYMIMGRLTYESIGKPLPGRISVVLTRGVALPPAENLLLAASVEEALSLCSQESEIFVVGGAKVYEQFLPRASRLVLTRIDSHFKADAFFPPVDSDVWALTEPSDWQVAESGLRYRFEEYVRRI